jgi:hypothetical protein
MMEQIAYEAPIVEELDTSQGPRETAAGPAGSVT